MGARHGEKRDEHNLQPEQGYGIPRERLAKSQYTNAHMALHQRHAGWARMDADPVNFSDYNLRLAFTRQALDP
jgi:hypothetical protein